MCVPTDENESSKRFKLLIHFKRLAKMKPLTKAQAIQSCKKKLREWIMVKRLYHIRIDELNANTVRVSAVHDGTYYSEQEKFGTLDLY